MVASNEVWVTFKQGLPMEVYMSKQTAEKHKFYSETVHHYIHVESGGSETREEQLVQTNLALSQQVEKLTHELAKAERRMGVMENLLGVPALLRKGKAA